MADLHILNGDCLAEQFPASLMGELLIMRECMCTGPIQAETIEQLYEQRIAYLIGLDPELTPEIYHQKTVAELAKLQYIDLEVKIHLWFEKDYFCVMNLLFMCYYLTHYKTKNDLFLVSPSEKNPYNFSAMNNTELMDAYKLRRALSYDEVSNLAQVWMAMSHKNIAALQNHEKAYSKQHPSIAHTIDIFVNAITGKCVMELPENQLRLIASNQPNGIEFYHLFNTFNTLYPYYGYSDLQVKEMLKKIQKK